MKANSIVKLSIITINLNNKSGLQKTIESVLGQTYANYEYIVIDGASTDGSVDIIKQYASKISYWISESDTGIYNAMNKGIAKATGEFCLFLNSGDRLFTEHVLSNVFSNKVTADVIYGTQVVEVNGDYRNQYFLYPEQISFSYFLKSSLPHQSTFIKRILFSRIGLYNENNSIVSDWEWFLLALFKFNYTFQKIEQTIAVINATGLSYNKVLQEKQKKEKYNAAVRYFPGIMIDIEAYSKLLNRYRRIPRFLRYLFSRFGRENIDLINVE